jgi:HSP20 family protein
MNGKENTMDTLVRDNRNGAGAQQQEQFVAPPASIREDGEVYRLEIEMPGVNKEGLEISIEKNELTITGRRSMPTVEGTAVNREMRPHNFRRVFEIDSSIDSGKISARIEQGLVTLLLPKAEQVKPRKIVVE